jgi:hypothetical protein
MQDRNTGEVLPDDHPDVIAMRKVFYEDFTLAERRAYHRAIFQNSKNAFDHACANRIMEAMVKAIGGTIERWAKPGEIEAMQEEFQRRKNNAG